MGSFAVNKRLTQAYFDTLTVESCGLIKLAGWAFLTSSELESNIVLDVPGRSQAPSHVYRTFRPDVAAHYGSKARRAGFVADFILSAQPEWISLFWRDAKSQTLLFKASGQSLSVQRPAYANLFDAADPLRRINIYGSGPPVDVLAPETELLVEELDGEILDFGCGAGALVRQLRKHGKRAFGLELDRDEIRRALREDVAPYIRLYGGSFPSPFHSKHFDAVVSIEVLEHIEDYRPALVEMARLTRDRLVITTPDMSSIPVLFAHQVVPWHLLEATHVSFFTQNSLASCLKEFFSDIEVLRVGPNVINGTTYYTSIMAVCRRPLV